MIWIWCVALCAVAVAGVAWRDARPSSTAAKILTWGAGLAFVVASFLAAAIG